MNLLFTLLFAMMLVPPDSPRALDRWRWEKRPLLLFAATANEAAYQEQIVRLQKQSTALAERDIVLLTCVGTDAFPRLRAAYRVDPEGFTAILIGKDGGEKWRVRKSFPVATLQEIVDAMPMGSQEARARKSK